jgi:DnaJ family protein C protein 28
MTRLRPEIVTHLFECLAIFPKSKHKPPQFRQYLTYEGVGQGTPSERERQYRKSRTVAALDNIYEHRLKKHSAENSTDSLLTDERDKREAQKIKTRLVT